MSQIKSLTIILAISVGMLVVVEFAARLKWGAPPLDARYECASSAADEDFKVFTYGGSTVYGTPIPEYGFVAQLSSAFRTMDGRDVTVCNIGEGGRDSSGVVLDLERTLGYEPDVVVVLTGHNEFLQPSFESTGWRRMREWVQSLAVVRGAQRLMKRAGRSSQKANPSILPDELPGHDRESADFAARMARYEANVEAIRDLAEGADAKLIFGTLAANLYDWPPTFQRVAKAAGGVEDPAAVVKALKLIDEGKPAEAAQALESRASSGGAPTPVERFIRARLTLVQQPGDQQALADLRRAKDDDPYPWRALSRQNEFVRELASSSDVVTLLDVEALLQAHSANGLPGFDLITDNCHPTPEANRLIANAILELIEPSHPGLSAQEHKIYVDGLGEELAMDYMLHNARYVMKVPFFNFQAARQYLTAAFLLDKDNWEIWANLATVELMQDHVELGRTFLEGAISLAPEGTGLTERRYAPYLKEALERHDIELPADRTDG